MKSIRWMFFPVLVLMMAMSVSCEREQFNADDYRRIGDSLSPVDTVDKYHNWVLTATSVVSVKAGTVADAQWVKILTADPRQTDDAEVVAQAPVTDGGDVVLNLTYPKRLSMLYAAVVDSEGRYTAKAFNPLTVSEVSLNSPLFAQQKLTYEPQPQVFAYCFEEEMPDLLSVDWDYNDVVLHIALERTALREMRIHVTLAAVGASKQVGGCLHLKGFSYDDVESLATVDDASFNVTNGVEMSQSALVTVQDKTPLLRGRGQGDAVINMFVDAHWATGDILTEDYGLITRKKYNVTKGSSTAAQTMVPRTVTYILTVKSDDALNALSFDLLDPFIIEQYNGGRWEVHTYTYRDEQVLYAYNLTDYRLPWALEIPYGKFRHPLDGCNIGFILRGIVGFGAYAASGHSFGEWSMNRNTAQDWYLNAYATENQVF